MQEQTKKQADVESNEPEVEKPGVNENPSTLPTDPFDPSKLRIHQSFSETTKKLLTTVPVGRPDPQVFVRTHKSDAYRDTFALIKLRDDRDAFYLVMPNIASALTGEYFAATIFTTITRNGIISLWPVRLPAPDGRQLECHRTEMEAAERCMTGWLRIKWNASTRAFDMFEPLGSIPEPEWSNLPPFGELLRIAFRDRLIDRFDHAVVQRLHGK